MLNLFLPPGFSPTKQNYVQVLRTASRAEHFVKEMIFVETCVGAPLSTIGAHD